MTRMAWRLYPLLAALLLAGCGERIEPGRQQGDPPLISGLTVTTVQTSAQVAADSFVGILESSERAMLAARIDGRVAAIAVRAGDRVRAGQLLVTIEDNQAGAGFEQAQAALAAARSAVSAAEARLALAEKTAGRYQRLAAAEAVTRQELDRVEAERQVARQDLAAAQAAVARSEAARSAASVAVAYSRVVAPFAGQVVRREVEAGSTVQPGTPLLVLDQLGKAQVRAQVPESRIGRLQLAEEVLVEIPSLGRSWPAQVVEIAPAADPRSRSFEVRAELPQGVQAASGLFARLHLAAQEQTTLLIPQTALVRRGQLHGVYVVEDGLLHYRLVKTGRELDEKVEILSGLTAGEAIVVEGVQRARHGAKVEN
jgi:membrane fusion protein, multidrug efflux system